MVREMSKVNGITLMTTNEKNEIKEYAFLDAEDFISKMGSDSADIPSMRDSVEVFINGDRLFTLPELREARLIRVMDVYALVKQAIQMA